MIRKSCLRMLRRVVEDSYTVKWSGPGHLRYKGMPAVYRWLFKHALIEEQNYGYVATEKGRELAARFAGYDCTPRGMLRHRGACRDCAREGDHRVARGESPAQSVVEKTRSGVELPGRQALALRCDGCAQAKRRLSR